jgi:hypothetical protein
MIKTGGWLRVALPGLSYNYIEDIYHSNGFFFFFFLMIFVEDWLTIAVNDY